MISREELKEVAKMQGNGSRFVSLYLNVNPLTNPKGEYAIWFKNAVKDLQGTLDRDVLKKVEKDLEDMGSYIQGNRRDFRKGLVFVSSKDNGFRLQYNLSVPMKSELIVDRSPYIKPLLDILDNYRRYAVLLVDKESARIFLIHLGEITEYGETHTPDVPGRHKKGGWFALSQNHYDRHIDYHVGLHLKDAVARFEKFLERESIDRLVMGGSDTAIARARGIMPRIVNEMVIGTASAELSDSPAEVFERMETVIRSYEKQLEEETVTELLNRAMKFEKAVVGLEGVLKALQEGRVIRLIFERDFTASGFRCTGCGALWAKKEAKCPYCGGKEEEVKYMVDLAAQKAVEQGGVVEVASKAGGLQRAGSIGAFLRF